MNRPTFPYPDAPAIPPADHWLDWLEQLQAEPLASISVSIAIYDLHDQCLVQTRTSVAALLGYTPEAIANMELLGLATLIHPDDLHRVADYYQHLTLLRRGEILSVEYRMRHVDGSWRWLRSQEIAISTANLGFPLQVLSVVQDITHHSSSLPPILTAADKVLNAMQSFPD